MSVQYNEFVLEGVTCLRQKNICTEAASWCKQLVACLPPLHWGPSSLLGHSFLWTKRGLGSYYKFHSTISSHSIHCMSPCVGATGLVSWLPWYSLSFNNRISSHLIPRFGPESDTSTGDLCYIFYMWLHYSHN